jgi:hypothetical protein
VVLLLVGAVVVVMGLVVFWIEPLGVLGVLERLTPNIVYRVRTELPLVALSFDDGPHPEFTPQVLEILKRHEAKNVIPALTGWANVWRAYGADHLAEFVLRNCAVTTRRDPSGANSKSKSPPFALIEGHPAKRDSSLRRPILSSREIFRDAKTAHE